MEIIQIDFKEKAYRFWIDGSNIERINHEALPRDDSKNAAMLIGFAPAVIISLFLLIWWASVGGGWKLAAVAFVLIAASVICGFVLKGRLETQSRNDLINASGFDVN